MYTVLLAFHILVCLLVILVVLIQSGKGAGLSNVFGGGGGGDALFSAPTGSLFIRKLTTGFAVAFFITTLMLTYLGVRRGLRTVTRGPWTQGVPVPIDPNRPLPGLPPGAQPAQPPALPQPPPPPPGTQ